MSTLPSSPILESALANVGDNFRTRIVGAYLEIKKRYSESHFDSSFDSAGISAGKFCEAVLRFLQHHLTSTHIAFGTNIGNFADEARKLITLPATSGLETLRVIMPRALVFLYTLRGKRGIGHVGGDIEANSIDIATIVRISDWVVCELIRVFHKLSIEEAQAIVDAISLRNLPDIWVIGGKKRVLKAGLSHSEKTLLLAYTDVENGILVEEILESIEHSNPSLFKSRVLKTLHSKRLIEFDQENGSIHLSPLGVKEVEENILSKK